MAKVLLVNGSPHENGCVSTAMDEIISTLNQNGIETEKLWLGVKPMADCIACGQCQKNGRCVFDDEVNKIAAKLDEYDAIIVGSPVYYGGPNGRLTSFMDRLFYSVPKARFAGKFGASIVSCRRGGSTAAFERLHQYFLMENMHVVASQYWNQVHGSNAEQVRQDEEGMQTMRTLAANMAFLIQAKQKALESGLEQPVYEQSVFTNFIR